MSSGKRAARHALVPNRQIQWTFVFPPFAKSAKDRISRYVALYMSTCAAFYKESRIRFYGTHQNQQENPGAWATHAFVAEPSSDKPEIVPRLTPPWRLQIVQSQFVTRAVAGRGRRRAAAHFTLSL